MKARPIAAPALAALLLAGAVHAQEHVHGTNHAAERAAAQDNASEREHVPPDPPQSPLGDGPGDDMADMMGMHDAAAFGKITFDQFEWRNGGKHQLSWDADGWHGGDYTRLWIKTMGEYRSNRIERAEAQLLVDRLIDRWWSAQAGLRHDFGEGPDRNWLALGIQGLAPYFIEIEATAFIGEGGRTAFRLSSDYDMLLTQRLILQPSLEANVHGRNDAARRIGSGVSDAVFGLRLRYEIRREFAPYIGVSVTRQFGHTRSLSEAAGEDPSPVHWVAGVRFWF